MQKDIEIRNTKPINSKIVKLLIEKKRVLLEDGTLLNIKDIFSLEIKGNKSYVDYQ